MKLVFATLIRGAERWQRIALTPLELAQLQLLFEERGLVPATSIGQVRLRASGITSRKLLQRTGDLTGLEDGPGWMEEAAHPTGTLVFTRIRQLEPA